MRGLLQRVVRWVFRTFGAFLERFAAVGVVQSGVVLAAQTFLALFPLFIAITAVLPSGVAAAVAQSLRTRFGISGSSDEIVRQLVGSREELRGGVTVIGAVVVLASATSFTRALQRVYEQAWGLPRMGVRGSIRGFAWLTGLVVYLVIIGTAIRLAGTGTPGTVIRTVLVVAGAVLLWWWTPFLLLLGRVRARSLLPGGLLTAAAMLVLSKVSSVVVPRTVRNNERQFGTIGVVFAVESWLVVVACTIVLAAVVGAVAAQTDGPLGRFFRGAADLEGWRRSAGPAPAERSERRGPGHLNV